MITQDSGALKKYDYCTTDQTEWEGRRKRQMLVWNTIVSSSSLSTAQEAVTLWPFLTQFLMVRWLSAHYNTSRYPTLCAVVVQISLLVPKALVCFQPSCGNWGWFLTTLRLRLMATPHRCFPSPLGLHCQHWRQGRSTVPKIS